MRLRGRGGGSKGARACGGLLCLIRGALLAVAMAHGCVAPLVSRTPAQEAVQKVVRRASWDEDSDSWVLGRGPAADQGGGVAGAAAAGGAGGGAAAAPGDGSPWGPRPVAAPGARRPVSAFARAALACGDMNPRFRSENILAMELDLPDRVTFDYYEGGQPDPRAQAAIDAMFAWDAHSYLVFSWPGAQGPAHSGAPRAASAAAYGGGGGARQGGGSGGGGSGGGAEAAARPGSGGRQRPASAVRGGRPAPARVS